MTRSGLTSLRAVLDHGRVRRLFALLCAAALAVALAPVGNAVVTPWFANSVGSATQVISVVGVGGSSAKMDVYQRGPAGWDAVAVGIPAHVGSRGMVPQSHDGNLQTPMGIFTLPFAFGTAANPGTGLLYVQTTPDHWWDGDMKSPTYNTMQVCRKAQCRFDTDPASGTENLDIAPYKFAVVMGVNPQRTPGNGGAFFVHIGDGPTAGCVAIDEGTLVKIMRWLQPGALIAVAK